MAATTQRLGIDIVATDRTRAAFTSVNSHMAGLTRSMTQMKGLIAGVGFGNVVASFVQGLIRVNTQAGEGKVAMDAMTSSYRQFAVNVGKAGLVNGLTDFANAVERITNNSKGLQQAIGGLMGGFLSEFSNSLAMTAKELDAIYGVIQKVGSAYDNMISNAQQGFDDLMGIGPRKTSLPPGTLEQLVYDGQTVNRDGKGDQLTIATAKVVKHTKAVKDLTISLYDIRGPAEAFSVMALDIKESDMMAKNFADTFQNNLASGLADAAANAKNLGDAFQIMKGSIINTLTDIGSALISSGTKSLFGLGGTMIGGAQGFMGFGGFYASGGNLGAGKWGIAGENGPEIVHGPASITPMGSGGSVAVTYAPSINIQGSADEGAVTRVMKAERERFRRELPGMIRDARGRAKI